MKFSLAKLKAAFGNQRAIEKEIDDTYTEDIINSIEQQPFAISNHNVCYAATNELAGYHFLQTIIVGKFKVKTFKGTQLTITGLDFELELESDMMELQSELSDVPDRYITQIDFVLDKNDLPKMDRSYIKSLILTAKKQSVEFSIIQLNDEEE